MCEWLVYDNPKAFRKLLDCLQQGPLLIKKKEQEQEKQTETKLTFL